MTHFALLLRLELRRAFRDPALFLLVGLYMFLGCIAVHLGQQWASDRAEMLNLVDAEPQTIRETRAAALEAFEQGGKKPGFSAFFPSTVPYRATLPTWPFAALSSGQTESFASAANVYAFADPWRSFDQFEAGFENPSVMAAGRFDLAFVIVVILPLLILVGLFDHWVRERELGIAQMELAEPVSPLALAASKALARSTILLGGMVLATGGLLQFIPGGDGASTITVLGVVLLYGLCWVAIALLVNALVRHSVTAALACGAAWLALVLLLPALCSASLDLLVPRPSAIAHANAMRELQADIRAAQREAMPVWPPMPDEITEIPERLRILRREIGERDVLTAPPNMAYEQANRHRSEVAAMLRFLSPAAVAQSALDRVAGTDATRVFSFRQQVRAFAGEARAFSDRRFVENRLLEAADYRDDGVFPRFHFTEPDTVRPALEDVAALVAAAFLFFVLARFAFSSRRTALFL